MDLEEIIEDIEKTEDGFFLWEVLPFDSDIYLLTNRIEDFVRAS